LAGRRVHERFEYELPVTIVHGAAEYETVSQNLSLGGMYLVTEVRLKYGTEVKLRFRLPTLKEDTECAGVVRWTKDDGIGVQFSSLRALEVWGLNQLFNKKRSG
jgi:Tfp pilus assembly protein PilZ